MKISDYFASWEEFSSLLHEKFNYPNRYPSKFIEYVFTNIQKFEYEYIPNWEDLDDTEIFDIVCWKKNYDGQLYVITDALYEKGRGPLKIDGFFLRELVQKHRAFFGEPFFNGDVLMISFEKKFIWDFHHNGASANIDLSNIEFG
ncbi:hypothetical protein ABLO27_09455 [Roseibium sp. SCPC15]|uniref:hypothetical protein n=1 Tax=Roseibium sp. SCP15 TaxID=3141376 RepID=UPI003335EA5E